MDQEHDCLPPLEHTGNWILSDAAVRSIAEAMERIIPTASTANEAFEKLRKLGLSPRKERRAIRWDEKNRRRRLKGLPEKPYPFPVTYQCDLFLPPQPGQINVKIEWSEGGTENDQSRDDEGA